MNTRNFRNALALPALIAGAPLLQGRVAGHGDRIIATRALDRFLEICAEWQEKHGRRPRSIIPGANPRMSRSGA